LNLLLFHSSAITSNTVLGLKKPEDVSHLVVEDEDTKKANRKFGYFIGQEFNAITLADWILFQPLNDLGPFPVACSRHPKYAVQLHPTCDFIYKVSVLGLH
jgi:hypothetical protein